MIEKSTEYVNDKTGERSYYEEGTTPGGLWYFCHQSSTPITEAEARQLNEVFGLPIRSGDMQLLLDPVGAESQNAGRPGRDDPPAD